MTLKELRKKYIGNIVNKDDLPDDFELVPSNDGFVLNFWSGDLFVYTAQIYLNKEMEITEISRMRGQRLVGEDATSSMYEPMRVAADEYDILSDTLEMCTGGKKQRPVLTLGEMLKRCMKDRPCYLFANYRMLGAVGSKKIGLPSDEELNIRVQKFDLKYDCGRINQYIYLYEEEVPERWKS